MQIARISGTTRVLGKLQGFLGLPVRDQVIEDTTVGMVPTMTTAWTPTPEELSKLNRGANVQVRLFGINHPPIMVEVGEVPSDEDHDMR